MSSREIEQQETNEVAGFIAKTFEILKNDQFNKIAFWAPSGLEFVIKDVNKFQQIVLPRYFRHNKINSFIRQLNMYGFHKSRADHSKSVFSHPLFIRDREDQLIAIKRKIKGRLDKQSTESTQIQSTPLKRSNNHDFSTTAGKELAETGNQLTSVRFIPAELHPPSFNILCTKEKLHSLMNLNLTLNNLPQPDLPQFNFDDEDSVNECVSIEHNIPQLPDNKENGCLSYKFMNPSCFFESMKKQNDI